MYLDYPSQSSPFFARIQTCLTPDPGPQPATLHPPAITPLSLSGEGEMSTANPPFQRTWAGVVKGQAIPSVTPAPLPPLAARLLQLYKDCVARGTWARLCFETNGGDEELSISCRVGASTSTTASKAAKKQGAKRPANERRRERARRRRKAWEERRSGPAVRSSAAAGAATVIAATGAASQPGAVAVVRCNSSEQEQQPGQEQQLGQEQQPQQEQQLRKGVAAVDRSNSRGRSSSLQQKQQPSAEAATINRSSSRRQEQQLLGGAEEEGAVEAVAAITTSVDAVAAMRQKTKVAVVERRAGARVLTLAIRRGSEVQMVCGAQSQPSQSWRSAGCPRKEKSWKKRSTGRSLKRSLSPL
jgi:hypothetical protein